MEILTNPLIAGLAGLSIGLVIALFVKLSAWFTRRSLEKENASLLRSHILMHDTGHKTLSAELEILKKQNENLRVTVATLKTKTDKSDLRTLHIYDKAIRLMMVRAPGFAPVWESTLAEAEVEMQQADTGVVTWIKRTIRPSLAYKAPQAHLQSTNQQSSSDAAPIAAAFRN
jgi:hypothetical protein